MFILYNKTDLMKGKYSVILIEDTIDSIQEKGLKDYVIYEGDEFLNGYPIIEGITVRKATLKEEIDLGVKELKDGEIFNPFTNKIDIIERPSARHIWVENTWVVDMDSLQDGERVIGNAIVYTPIPPETVKPKWNKEKYEWEDIATNEDKLAYLEERIITLRASIDDKINSNFLPTEEETNLLNSYIIAHKEVAHELAISKEKSLNSEMANSYSFPSMDYIKFMNK